MMMLINNLINDIVVLMTLHRCFDCAQTYQCTQPCLFKFIFKHLSRIHIPRGLTARIAGFHPAGPGSTPGVGTTTFLSNPLMLLGYQDYARRYIILFFKFVCICTIQRYCFNMKQTNNIDELILLMLLDLDRILYLLKIKCK